MTDAIPGHAGMLAAADQAAKMYDGMVDACIEAAKALARDNPHWGDLESRAVQAALMEKMFTKIGRADLMNMLVCAVTRLASPAPSVP
ncbi:hypothetical protein [Mycobacteroides abscessus]|uniref:hypothetical protein n=1 Tax=Mycobacteroides abscessus TaxID=36809 RepID=UPI000C269515|nr:hypothetical protein [Mycobacteroides abscessus]